MAQTLSKYLKLRIDSNLTANAKYNLSRLDLLGSTFLTDTTNLLNIRSQTNIQIEPESADIDGSGTGGTVSVGTASHIIDSIDLWATSVTVPVSLGLLDQASGGNKHLRIKYKSDANGSLDTSADRNLVIDLEGADRSLVLGGSLSVLGANGLTLNLTGTSSVTVPQSGTLSTLAGIETLTNKSISGLDNTLSNVPYSALILTGSIVNADVHASAAIAYSKLALGGSITNSDISGTASVAYSKLNLSGSILDSDVSPSASIARSKLNLTGTLVNADIASSAAISYSKLALTGAIQSTDLAAGVLDSILPAQSGNAGKFLTTDGSTPSWASVGGVSGVAAYSEDWTSGTTKSVTHSLGTEDVVVSIHDNAGQIIYADVDIQDTDSITITSSEAPTGTWRVTVHAAQ